MKWKNKGHEFDLYIKDFFYNSGREVYIFGCGICGLSLAEKMKSYDCFKGYIDNDEKKIGQIVNGKEVISLAEYLDRLKEKKAFVILGVSSKYVQEIEQQLKECGLCHGKQYFKSEEFLKNIWPLLLVYEYNEIHIELAQICLTERCTLKCKKCAHACHNVDNNASDLSLSESCKSADAFFAKVDYIQEFVLIGGEPLLYKELAKVIEYIGIRYRKQMGIFSITTNGTIVPSNEVLQLCKQFDVVYRISNYTKQLPKLKQHHKRLITELERYEISYSLAPVETEWIDYGFEYINREESENEMIKVFDMCKTPCREVRGNKYYYCVMARSVSDNLKYGIGKDDYLDLEELCGENYKKILFEFERGYSEKGYLDMCRRCNGKDAKEYPIVAAEQVSRDEKK